MPTTHATLWFSADPKIAGTVSVPVPGGSTPDIKVLNFALALETLEAELYRQAVFALSPPSGGTDMFGNPIPGSNDPAFAQALTYIQTFAKIESEHQKFLEGQLGGNWAVKAGAMFDFGFATGNNLGKPALTPLQAVQLVYAAEQTGVSAYLGGAGPGGLTPGGAFLGVAASILGTEARHTTAVAILLNVLANKNVVATAPLAPDTGTAGGHGLDTALAPDNILYMGGQVANDTTVAGDGKINPISGPNGFVFVNM